MKLRLRKVVPDPEPAFPNPFPVRLFIVGEGADGNEAFRTDLGVSMHRIGETVTLSECTFKLGGDF